MIDYLHMISNKVIKKAKIPQQWKKFDIILYNPDFTKTRIGIENYRPISLSNGAQNFLKYY